MKKFLDLGEIKSYLDVESDVESAKIQIAPKQADFLLKNCNRFNRRVKTAHVEQLRRDMEQGNWYSDVDYIAFDKNGVLVNGQHRLKALSEANVDGVLLKFDFNVDQHISMDTGKARTYADQIAIFKKMDENILPNRFKMILVAGLRLSNPKINLSNTELERLWLVYMKDFEKCEQMGLFNLGTKSGAAVVKSSLFWAYLSEVPMDDLLHIVEVLKTGISKNERDVPVIRLRDALVDLKGGGKANDLLRAKYTQQCIFNYLQGFTSARLPSNPLMHYQELDLMLRL